MGKTGQYIKWQVRWLGVTLRLLGTLRYALCVTFWYLENYFYQPLVPEVLDNLAYTVHYHSIFVTAPSYLLSLLSMLKTLPHTNYWALPLNNASCCRIFSPRHCFSNYWTLIFAYVMLLLGSQKVLMGRGTVYHDVTFVGLIHSCWLKFFMTVQATVLSHRK